MCVFETFIKFNIFIGQRLFEGHIIILINFRVYIGFIYVQVDTDVETRIRVLARNSSYFIIVTSIITIIPFE